MIYKLKPALKSYIWGGTNLKTKWNKVSDEPTLSESWELSFHPVGPSTVDGGEHDGKPLCEVVDKAQWGDACKNFEFFPVLNKLIDSKTNLSVQVHPSDEYALAHEHQYGKTEMWHILDAEPGAKLYLGLNRDMTAEQFAAAIDDKTICDYLNAVPVRPGETYFIPSGTLHAIGGGITLFEIQQNSSLTYRVYDYDRRDANGNARELHVDKAKLVANLNKYVVPNPARGALLGECKYFAAYRYNVGSDDCEQLTLGKSDSFVSLTVVDGNVDVCSSVCSVQLALRKGDTIFATAGEHFVADGNGTVVVTCVNGNNN